MHRRWGLFTLAMLLAATAFALPAQAGDRAHDNGFFLRLSGGGGSASTDLEYGGSKLKLDGTTADLNVAIGAIVARNLALHGTLWGWAISNPDMTLDGFTAESNGNLMLSAVGVGLTYYFMPVNMYLSGSVGAGQLTAEEDGHTSDSDKGPIVDITLGKEWWVGSSWGLGVALSGGYHSVPDGGIDASWQGTSFAVRFTATLN